MSATQLGLVQANDVVTDGLDAARIGHEHEQLRQAIADPHELARVAARRVADEQLADPLERHDPRRATPHEGSGALKEHLVVGALSRLTT